MTTETETHDTTVYEALNAALIRIQWAMANTLPDKAPPFEMLPQLAEGADNVTHAAEQLASLAKEMREVAEDIREDSEQLHATIIDWADVIVEADKEDAKAAVRDAAPELLRELRRMREAANCMADPEHCLHGEREHLPWRELVEKADAAIGKATT